MRPYLQQTDRQTDRQNIWAEEKEMGKRDGNRLEGGWKSQTCDSGPAGSSEGLEGSTGSSRPGEGD